MGAKQYFTDTILRFLMLFLLMPIIESTIDSIFHSYQENNIESFELLKSIIKNVQFAYGGYIYDNKLYII